MRAQAWERRRSRAWLMGEAQLYGPDAGGLVDFGAVQVHGNAETGGAGQCGGRGVQEEVQGDAGEGMEVGQLVGAKGQGVVR